VLAQVDAQATKNFFYSTPLWDSQRRPGGSLLFLLDTGARFIDALPVKGGSLRSGSYNLKLFSR
jgi:hypothetical protein